MHNSINDVGRVLGLVFYKLTGHVLYLHQVSWKCLKDFQSYGVNTIFTLKYRKGHYSIDIVSGVTVLVFCTLSDVFCILSDVFCTLSDQVFMFVQSFERYLEEVQSYCADTIFTMKYPKRHKSVNNIVAVTILANCTFS